jgi:Trypsin-like peptidase domain
MFRLKTAIIILILFLSTQNVAAQKTVKRPISKKTAATESNNSSKTKQAGTNDGRVFSSAISGIAIIATVCSRGGVSQGSGFVVGDEYVVTNRHVVECGRATKLKLLVSQELFDADGVFFHPDKDIAVLRVPKLNGKDISLQFSKVPVRMNNLVYVLGNPKGVEGYFTKGNVRRISGDKFFFDAIIAPGSSGSPVLDAQGRVVGLETTVTNLAGGVTFGGATSAFEVAGLLSSVEKGLIANALEREAKPLGDSESGSRNPPANSKPDERKNTSGIGEAIGALLGVSPSSPKNENGAIFKPRVAAEPGAGELIAEAENKLKYSPQMSLETAQKVLSRLPKESDRREPYASLAHGIIAESYARLNQTEQAAQHILQAWKDGDFVRVKVKQVRENKDFSNSNPDSWKGFVNGVIIIGNKTLIYRQDENSVGQSFPNQSFSAKSSDVEKVEYNSSSKKLSFVVKIRTQSGRESKKDFQFYPPEASWQTGSMSYGMLKQVDCRNCSDILFALVKASNEFVRQEKQASSAR